MKASRFNYITTARQTGDLLLYNTYTGAFIAVSKAEAEIVSDVLKRPSTIERNGSLEKILRDDGFLVDLEIDETARVKERGRIGVDDPNRLDVFVLPNMNCNFKCLYCYETHQKGEMNFETERRIISWLEKIVGKFHIFNLCWFGGESLISYGRLISIQRAAKKICKNEGVEFTSHMTTNGFLLSERIAKELVENGVLRYQITIDGDEQTHNAQRPLRGGGPTYTRVLRNLIALARIDSGVKITLRVNYNDQTFGSVPNLLADIPNDIRGQVEFDCQRIFGQNDCNIQPIYPIKQTASTLESFYAMSKEIGFVVTMRSLAPQELTYCYADRRNEYLITQGGDVFKCTLSSFLPQDRIGFITGEGSIEWEHERAERWFAAPAFEEKCDDCVYMPLCMGGCRYKKVYDGTTGTSCVARFAGIEQRLQQRYEEETPMV